MLLNLYLYTYKLRNKLINYALYTYYVYIKFYIYYNIVLDIHA